MLDNSYGHWVLSENCAIPKPDTIGFIYCISTPENKHYIGKKLLINKKSRKPLKGRQNKRHYIVDSDWRNYTGSSAQLNEYIEKNGKQNIKFEILSFHKSKSLLAYAEVREIINRNALFDSQYFNEVLNCRFRIRK